MLAVRKRYVGFVYGYDMKSANLKMHNDFRDMCGKNEFFTVSFRFCNVQN